MIWLKASLLAFIGATISSADISWIVTDTGTTPIIGAVVRLEKSGQTATTGADGHFTLNISTSNTPSTRRSFSTNLSASIAGNMMNVMTSEHSIIEIAIFDLNGKVLSIIHQSVDMGIHSILLPQKGAGVYLYKVKSGNIELILKGNTLGGIAFKSSQITQNRSIITMAKQTKATAIIDDVITCTKAGWLNYHCVFGNSDTTGIVIKMIVNAGDITDVDGNVYQWVFRQIRQVIPI